MSDKPLEQIISDLAGVLESEVIRQGASLLYGEVNWNKLAERAVRHLAKEQAFQGLLGGTRPTLQIFGQPFCNCAPDIQVVRHEFGRGSFCQTCGLPA